MDLITFQGCNYVECPSLRNKMCTVYPVYVSSSVFIYRLAIFHQLSGPKMVPINSVDSPDAY